jgi:predicted nucleic acid-binding Zn ribbon protein
MTSKMPTIYVHYFGTESAKKLLEAKGIIQRNSMSVNVLKAKTCPNCSESNKPDSKFCSRCKFVLSYDAFNGAIEKKARTAREAEQTKQKMQEMEKKIRSMNKRFETFTDVLIRELPQSLNSDGDNSKPFIYFNDPSTGMQRLDHIQVILKAHELANKVAEREKQES